MIARMCSYLALAFGRRDPLEPNGRLLLVLEVLTLKLQDAARWKCGERAKKTSKKQRKREGA